MVLQSAVVSTVFTYRECCHIDENGSACPGLLTIDGKEFGVLRVTESLAFGHELLYHWSDRMAAGQSDTWRTSWLLAIMADKSLNQQQQKELWDQLRIVTTMKCMLMVFM